MWVVNQDGIGIVKTEALALDIADIKNGIARIWGATADHDYVMGVYGSIDEARGVIDDFKSAVLRGQKVYMMPKAKEAPKPSDTKEVS